MSANVPPEGIGFTIETTEATIVDYGTEFSVEAGSGASEVHVFNGLVRVRSRRGTDDQAGKVYELAGDDAYTLTELAAEIARQSGKAISYP